MASSNGIRSTRRTTASSPPQSDISVLSNLDRLILAQAVYELGANAWPAVAKLLSKHPLLSRPKTFFTAQSCHLMYSHLLREADLDCTEANNATRAPTNLRLAQRHYQTRCLELRDLIAAEEVKFKSLAAEIDDIRSGLWDDKITAKVIGAKPSPETPAVEPPLVREKTPDIVVTKIAAEEVSGPDLSSSGSQLQTIDSTPHPGVIDMDTKEPITVELEVQPILDGYNSPGADAVSLEVPGIPLIAAIDGPQSTVEQEEQEEGQPFEMRDVIDIPPLASSDSPPNQTEVIEMSSDVEVLERSSMTPEARGTGEVLEDEGGSSGGEPLHGTQAAHARHSSVSPGMPPHTRSNELRKSPPNAPLFPPQEAAEGPELLPTQDDHEASIMETDDQGKVDTPLIEDDQAASPSTPDIASLPRREIKRKASFVEIEPRDKKRTRDESEPVDEDEHGPSGPAKRRRAPTGEQVALKRFQYVIGMLHSQISQHRSGNIFHNPIKNSEAPDYHEIVKRPIDLKTIKARIKDGVIANSLEYQRDVYLMFTNALMYNRPGSDIYHMAENMMLESEGYIHTFRQTEGFVRGTHRV